MNTARTVFEPLPGWSMPSWLAMASLAATTGKVISTLSFSLIQSIHLMCENTWSTLMPISVVFSASKSAARR